MERYRLILTILIVNCVLLTQLGCMAPKITFEKVVHDFGEVGPEKSKTTDFKFTNTGFGLLKIKEVDTCCGVSAELSKKLYLPGESGTVKVEYSSGRYLGLEDKTLNVCSNDKANPKVELTIKAKIVQKVAWEPETFKLLFRGENTSCPKITVSSLDNQPFSITAFKSSLNCITADVDPSVKATKFVLEPKINPENLRENMRGYIHIILTHPEWKRVSIPFNVLTRFIIDPPQIIVLDAEPKEPIKRYVWIHNIYGQDFEVESASSQNNFIRLLSQKKVGLDYQFELEITPPDVEGERQIFTDVFYVNIKEGEKIEIPCHGFYVTRE
ncbi:MAG: DUF1573 domain-containing protein [Nitrospirota bacterium]|nr:DUF1573 domain-containing protein [Nitrospirota bacterium]